MGRNETPSNTTISNLLDYKPLNATCFDPTKGSSFAGSNPAEAVGFFRAKKSSACLPSEGK
jgi:hypothetical protein